METVLRIDALTELVIGCGIAVHRALGPGLLESVYQDCMVIELTANGLYVVREHRVPIEYRGQRVRDDLKLDLFVERRLVVETKATDRIHPVHVAQVITYVKLAGAEAGLILNFNATTLRAGLRRVDHPDVYARKHPKATDVQREPTEN